MHRIINNELLIKLIIKNHEEIYNTLYDDKAIITNTDVTFLYNLSGFKVFKVVFNCAGEDKMNLLGFKKLKSQQAYNYQIGLNNIPFLVLKCYGVVGNKIYQLDREGVIINA